MILIAKSAATQPNGSPIIWGCTGFDGGMEAGSAGGGA